MTQYVFSRVGLLPGISILISGPSGPDAHTGMAGLGLFFHKRALALAPRGLLRSAYDFLCQGMQKVPGHRGKCQGSFDPRPELHAKNVFWAPSEALVTPFSIQKPSQKHQNLTSIG
jgi:hypothetical protein